MSAIADRYRRLSDDFATTVAAVPADRWDDQSPCEDWKARDVVRHVREGRAEAMQLVRQAGRELGEVLAASVNFFNPGVIVIGGDIAHADEHLLAGVREVVYQRAVPLGTRSLRIVRSALDDRAGVIGAAAMVIEHVLAPEAVDRMLAGLPQPN